MKIRVALVGFGFMGQMHARIYQALPDVEIVGIADKFSGTADALAKLGIQAPVFASLPELLKAVDPTLVDVCLPTDLHAEAVIAAANAGKHVFCEKPFALDVPSAERALAAVEKAGVFLQVGQCIRFWPEYQALEKFIKSGRGGKLVSLFLQRRASRPSYSQEDWLNQPSRSGGAALDLHIHDTDFVLHLLGKPQAVQSVAHQQPNGAYDQMFTQYLYPDVAVTANGAWDYPAQWGFQMAFQAVFEKAVVEFDSQVSPSLHLTEGAEPRQPLAFEKPAVGKADNSGGNVSDLGGYYNEIVYFIDRLRTGRAPEIATGQQALESLRTALAERQSAETRKPVAL
jgi:predicted dehydrogenase